MFYFTNDQIDEIEKRLAVRAKKDTDFESVSDASEDDLVAIIHNGRNMICRLDKLPGRLIAKRYDEIPAEITEENILETPTAFSISVLKTLLGIEYMPEFDDDTPYQKGSYVRHTDDNGILRGYIFTHNKPAGYWDDSKVEEINYKTLLDSVGDILDEFKSGGRVYILESYFTDGKANRALADEDGVNIKQFYAKKSDIPDVNREIAEAIAVKLDNTPKGSHDVPIYIKPNPSTGHGESDVIDALHLPGDIHSDQNIYAYGGVAAGGIADLGESGSGGGTGNVGIEFDPNVEYEEGQTYNSSHGVVQLPAYKDWDDLKPENGIPKSDLAVGVRESLDAADTAYQKPQDGIPKTDLSDAVQTSLGKADTALQEGDIPEVVEYNDLDSESEESTSKVPTAYGVKIIKDHINVESLTEFSTAIDYKRGDLCKVTDGIGIARGYRFIEDKDAGIWQGTKVERLTFKTLARPLHILESDMLSMLVMN